MHIRFVLQALCLGVFFMLSASTLEAQCDCPATCSVTITDVNNSPSNELFCAVNYLCAKDILDDNDNTVEPNDNILREDLAKINFIGLYGNENAAVPSDSFPTPFADLQGSWIPYYKYAKALSYLEYGDGISPFDRDFYNFRPGDFIPRKFAVKVFVETFDLQLSANATSPYADVPNDSPELPFIRTLYDLEVLSQSEPNFRPNDLMTRGEAFLILYRILCDEFNNNPPPTPLVGSAAAQSYPASGDYFRPGNYHPFNLLNQPSISDAVFDAYSHTSFNIPGKNMPLLYAHNYSSQLTELPRELFPICPLGRGWSHSYNSYIVKIPGYNNQFNNIADRYVVFWPGGSMYDFTVLNGSNVTFTTRGVYDEVTFTPTQITIRKKNQMVYTYERQGGGTDAPFVLKSVRDRNNNTISLQYTTNAGGKVLLTTVTGTAGRRLTFTYDAEGYIQTVTDPIGRQISYDYQTPTVDLVKYTDAENFETNFVYGTGPGQRHLMTNITLPNGNTIDNQYFQRKLTASQTNMGGAIPQQIETQVQHQLEGQVYGGTTSDVMVNANGTVRTQQYEMNGLGKIQEVTTPSNDINEVEYNDPTNPTLPTKIVVDNILTEYDYFPGDGNVKEVRQPLGVTHKFTYTNINDIATYVNPRSFQTTFGYDGTGNLKTVAAPIGTTTMNYNGDGQVTEITNPEGIKVTFGYNAFGNQNMTTAPGGLISGTSYDGVSRVKTQTNPNNQTTTYDYDARDLVTQTTDALNHVTAFNFDGNANLKEITNAKGEVTTLTYDINDFLKSESFGGFTKSYDYDTEGKLTRITKPDGTQLDYTYNGTTGLLSGDDYATYTYDGRFRVETVTRNGKVLTYEYDDLNRMTATIYDGQRVSYTYDPSGNVETMTYPGNFTVTYTYDANDRMETVTDWLGVQTLYTYLDDGRLSGMVYPNGIATDYEYDPAGRMTKLIHFRNGTPWIRYVYGLDDLGNHLQEEKIDQPFGYPMVPAENYTYTYSAINRLLTQTGDGGTNLSWSYDDNGNALTKSATSYTWDVHDMLLSYSNGTNNFTYEYDGLGNRRVATRDGMTEEYVLDVNGMSRVLVETDAGGNALNYYIHGLGMISRIKATGDTNYYTYDFRGSTVAMTDANGATTHTYNYNDFGTVVDAVEADENRYRYVGQFGVTYEAEDLTFMRARYYDASVGRFLSEDPIWSTNLYPYADNNPITLSDPEGLRPIEFKWWENAVDAFFDKSEKYITARYYAGHTFDSKGNITGYQIRLDPLYELDAYAIAVKLDDLFSVTSFQDGIRGSFVIGAANLQIGRDENNVRIAEFLIDGFSLPSLIIAESGGKVTTISASIGQGAGARVGGGEFSLSLGFLSIAQRPRY